MDRHEKGKTKNMVVVGLDEAGCGPAFGSLWAAAVHLPCDVFGLADSKKLTEKKRKLLRSIIEECAHYGLGEVTHTEIDAWGMARARRVVFHRALDDYIARGGPTPTKLEIDGDIYEPRLEDETPFTLTRGGDATIACISAASIMAKTTRDAQIVRLCEEHPDLHEKYDICSNKGYLSRRHIDGLKEHGKSVWHRQTFRVKGVDY